MSNQLQKQYDQRIAELYNKGVKDLEPPEYLDRYVLFEANRQEQLSPLKRFNKHWTAPASLAAVILLSVILVMNITEDNSLETLEQEKNRESQAAMRPAPLAEDAQMPGDNQGFVVKETADQAKKTKVKKTQGKVPTGSAVSSPQVKAKPKPIPSIQREPAQTAQPQDDKIEQESTNKTEIIEPLVEGQSFGTTAIEPSAPAPSQEVISNSLAPPAPPAPPAPQAKAKAKVSEVNEGATADKPSSQSITNPQYDIPKPSAMAELKTEKEETKTIIGSALEDPTDPEVLLKEKPPVPESPPQAKVNKSDFERRVEQQDSMQLKKIESELNDTESIKSNLPKAALMADAQQWFKLIIGLYGKPTEEKRFKVNVRAFKARHPNFNFDEKMKIVFPKYKAIP